MHSMCNCKINVNCITHIIYKNFMENVHIEHISYFLLHSLGYCLLFFLPKTLGKMLMRLIRSFALIYSHLETKQNKKRNISFP